MSFESRARLLAAGLTLGFLAGCGGPQANRIVDLHPYTGEEPGRLGPLPPALLQQPPVGPAQPLTPERAWTPPGGFSGRWEYIVIHHSANDRSTPQGMTDWHKNGRKWDDLGYHFVIGNGVGYPDGKVYVGGRWPKQMHGAHCKTPGNQYNERGIGVCLIGDFEKHPPTERQIESLARLLSFLSQRCDIPKGRILTHGGITRKTDCPGRFFVLGQVLRRMSDQTVSASTK